MIDLPEGATGLIADNVFVQGRNEENRTGFVLVAAAARPYRSAGLTVENNDPRIAQGETRSPAFVADYGHERLAVGASRLRAGVQAFETRWTFPVRPEQNRRAAQVLRLRSARTG